LAQTPSNSMINKIGGLIGDVVNLMKS